MPELRTGTALHYFGDYVLLGEIASGGMGTVYFARHINLNRDVAVKVLRAEQVATSAAVRRFRTECEAMAALKHPGIVSIYETGEHKGQHFFSMELVEGRNLAQLIAQCQGRSKDRKEPLQVSPAPGRRDERFMDLAFGTRAWQRAMAQLLAKIARAIHYAHQRGVLHRDLKPSNILLDSQDEPHLTDFGIAKLLETGDNATLTLAILGTPSYMSPEQAAGSRDVTTTADIYSLGAILFEMLTGRAPFLGASPQAVLRQVEESDPPRPRSLNPKLDRDLEVICLKCLKKDAKARYQTGEALAEDLERWLAGKPITARPVSVAERLSKAARRRPAVAGLTLALISSVMVGLFGMAAFWFDAKVAKAITLNKENELASKRAEEFVRRDRADRAVAGLALAVQTNPKASVTTSRLLSLLTHRSFALPDSLPLQHEAIIHEGGFSPDGKLLLTLCSNAPVRIWELSGGLHLLCSIAHSNGLIYAALFSPDGGRIVTASADKTARIWNSFTGQPLGPPLPHDGPVMFAGFSPDGARVVTASDDKTARIWPADNSRAPPLILSHPAEVASAEFSPDGRTVMTACHDGQVRVWDVQTGTLTLGPLRHIEADKFPQFSPDSDRVLTLASNGVVAVWEVRTGRVLTDAIRHEKPIFCAQFSPDGEKVLTGANDGTARVWDARTGQALTDAIKHTGDLTDGLWAAQFSPDGQILATAAMVNTVCLWDALSGARVREPIRHEFWTVVAAFSPDGHRLVTGSFDKTARLWDIRPRAALNEPLMPQGPVNAVAFSADGKLLLTVSADGAARFWDAPGRRQVGAALPHGAPVLAGRFSGRDTQAVTFSQDGVIRQWNVRDGLLLKSNRVHQGVASLASFSHDGERLITAWADGVRICQVVTGGVGPFLEHAKDISQAEFSPNGRQIVTAGPGWNARVWDAHTGQMITDRLQHDGPIMWVEFSPDGASIATASMDHRAKVWNASTYGLVSSFTHLEAIVSVRFSPDSQKLVSASGDHTVSIWDRWTGRELVEPLRHGDIVRAASFSRNGRNVATVCRDGTARVWESTTGLPLTEWLRMPPRPSPGICEFSPDGNTLVASPGSGSVWVWDMLVPEEPAPDWLPALADVISGESSKPGPAVAEKSWQQFQQLKARIANSTASDFYTRWAKWFFADPAARSISPGSRLPTAEYIRRRIETGALDGLREVIRLDPANGLALARLAERIAEPGVKDNLNRAGAADFLSRRALEFAPNNPQVQSIRAAIIQQAARPP